MTIFVSDSMVETVDTTLASHTPATGGVWTKHGAFAARSCTVKGSSVGYAQGDGVGLSSIYYNAATPPSADYSVQASLSRAGTDALVGLLGRMHASLVTWYQIYFDDTSVTWALESSVSGTPVALGNYADAGFTVGVTRTIKLDMTGTSISVYIDGTLRIGPIANSAVTAAGFAGLRTRLDGHVAGTYLAATASAPTGRLFRSALGGGLSGLGSPGPFFQNPLQ